MSKFEAKFLLVSGEVGTLESLRTLFEICHGNLQSINSNFGVGNIMIFKFHRAHWFMCRWSIVADNNIGTINQMFKGTLEGSKCTDLDFSQYDHNLKC